MDLGAGLSSWLNDQLEAVDGQSATYIRGAKRTTITVVPGSTLFAVSSPDLKARVIRGDADFLFPRSYLDDAGFGVPQKGDRMTLTLNGESCTFEASTPTGERVWRFSDAAETQIRLHMRRVE